MAQEEYQDRPFYGTMFYYVTIAVLLHFCGLSTTGSTAVAHPAVQTVVSVQPTDWNLTEKFTTKTASLSHYNLTNSPSTNPSDRQATSNKQVRLEPLQTQLNHEQPDLQQP